MNAARTTIAIRMPKTLPVPRSRSRSDRDSRLLALQQYAGRDVMQLEIMLQALGFIPTSLLLLSRRFARQQVCRLAVRSRRHRDGCVAMDAAGRQRSRGRHSRAVQRDHSSKASVAISFSLAASGSIGSGPSRASRSRRSERLRPPTRDVGALVDRSSSPSRCCLAR